MKLRYLPALLLCVALIACSRQEAETELPEPPRIVIPDDAVPGQLLVRFDDKVAEILRNAGLTKSGPMASLPCSGIPSVDEVLDLVAGYSIERVFPVDSRTEDRAEKSGLHLWYLVRFSEDADLAQVAADLSRLGEVSTVQLNRTIKRADNAKALPFSPENLSRAAAEGYFDDTYLPLQWHLVNNGDLGPDKFVAGADVNVRKAWDLCTGDASVVVAVLDEGVDVTHPDLRDAMWVNDGEIWRSHDDNDGNGYAGDYYGYNFARNSAIINTDNIHDTGHGSHVAGVIGATNNNGLGISSIAGGNGSVPGVRIMSCQIFSGNYAGTVLDEVRAIKYAADNGAVILQCSWGYTSGAANAYEWQPMYTTDEEWIDYNPLESRALDYFIHNAGSAGGVIEGGIAVFAGGNESAPAAGYPGAYPDFVSVAATAADFTPAIYTNYGPGTTISAPGGDQDYYYEYGSGETAGSLGCVFSTLPTTIASEGYGYMEGTSMACPHVSGVLALGISYAKQLRKHFKAQELIDLLYQTATPIEQFWDIDNPKLYYKYVIDLGQNYLSSIDLHSYAKRMGSGQVNAYAFLKAIEGSGAEMTFPNVYVAVDGSTRLLPELYFKNSAQCTVKVEDSTVASAVIEGKYLVVNGLKEGQTSASISGGKDSYKFIITVRKGAAGNGWL